MSFEQQFAILRIIKGLPPVPGDIGTSEEMETLDLLDKTGLALDIDGWSPTFPALKNGGTWADSVVSDGRQLIAAAVGTVTETMKLTAGNVDIIQRSQILSRLSRFQRACRNYHQSQFQIHPVYIEWKPVGGIGSQFGLIYNIEIAEDADVYSNQHAWGLTLTIERSPEWHGVRIGGNPNEWTAYIAGKKFNTSISDVTNSSVNLLALFSDTLENKSEWTSSGYSALLTNNAIKIPAASIPGDAPALMFLTVLQSSSRLNFFVGRKTAAPLSLDSSSAPITYRPNNNTFNGGDAGALGTNATLANDTGAVRAGGAANAQRIEISFASAANALRVNFPNADTGSANRFIGTWMVFLRCRQVNGASGDISMYLRYGTSIASDNDGIRLEDQVPQIIGTTGNTTAWGLTYMGMITVPFAGDGKAHVGMSTITGAYGLDGGSRDFDIALFASRSTGTGVLYIADLILIPYDEAAFQFLPTVVPTATRIFVDNTGYAKHGVPGVFAGITTIATALLGDLVDYRGDSIELEPNVDNYLYFLNSDNSLQSRASDTYTVQINIVPRWLGVRDK